MSPVRHFVETRRYALTRPSSVHRISDLTYERVQKLKRLYHFIPVLKCSHRTNRSIKLLSKTQITLHVFGIHSVPACSPTRGQSESCPADFRLAKIDGHVSRKARLDWLALAPKFSRDDISRDRIHSACALQGTSRLASQLVSYTTVHNESRTNLKCITEDVLFHFWGHWAS